MATLKLPKKNVAKNHVPTSVAITREQYDFLKSHNVNVSILIREFLDDLIQKMREEMKNEEKN